MAQHLELILACRTEPMPGFPKQSNHDHKHSQHHSRQNGHMATSVHVNANSVMSLAVTTSMNAGFLSQACVRFVGHGVWVESAFNPNHQRKIQVDGKQFNGPA